MESALRIANGIYEVGGTSCQWEQLGAALGMAPKGGGFRVMVSTARVFGLVAYDKTSVRLTELGTRACDPAQVARAKADAFLRVPLYEKLFDRFKATTLPPDQALENEMAALGVLGSRLGRPDRHPAIRTASRVLQFRQGPYRHAVHGELS